MSLDHHINETFILVVFIQLTDEVFRRIFIHIDSFDSSSLIFFCLESPVL